MARYRSLEDVFDEEDEFKLLEVRPKGSGRSSSGDRHVEIVEQVNGFFEAHGRLPDEDGLDIEEMKLGTSWEAIRKEPTEAMLAVDRNGLLQGGQARGASPAQPSLNEVTPVAKERSWRDDPLDEDIPTSLADIFDDDDEDLPEAVTSLRHVTPAAEREKPAHRADMHPCREFDRFEAGFVEIQEKLDLQERRVSPVEDRQEIRLFEGDYLIHRGLLAYVAEKTELSRRGGKPDHRFRIVFSNGMESDPLMSSLRKALADDKTARYIHRPGFGPLDPNWHADAVEVTGTVYVARSRSQEPEIAEVRNILHKIGVTSQDVRRRVADARNDATFLLAEVDIVATYDLKNLDRMKVENLLHRFFDVARPSGLKITDRFGKPVYPREWFYVLPEHVREAVRLIEAGELHQYRYDPDTQAILKVVAPA